MCRPKISPAHVDYTPGQRSNIASVWYQDDFATPAATRDLWAVYLPILVRHLRHLRQWPADRRNLADSPPYAEFRVPLYFEFPASLFHAGANTIDIHGGQRAHAGSWFALLSGALAKLKPAYAYLHFVQVTLVRDDRGTRAWSRCCC